MSSNPKTTSMLERMARRMTYNINILEHGKSNDDGWEGWMGTARVVLQEMRQPSDAMVDKAWMMIGSNLRYEEVYCHLIDAALEEA
jgi:hypothetical protein